jgi:CheY-like chemotaxis protein
MKGPHLPLLKRKILVVDDDEISRLVAFEILAALGAEVHLAEEPEEAMRLVQSTRYDLLLLDLYLPGMHGTELASAIEFHDDSLKGRIMFLTGQDIGDTTPEDDMFADRNVFTKPLNPEQFLHYFQKTVETDNDISDTEMSPAEIPGIDIPSGIKNFMGHEQAFFSTLKIFPEYSLNFISDYESNLQRNNFEECFRLAHSLKGSSAMIGATKICEIAKKLERICENTGDINLIMATYNELKENILSINKSLSKQKL